MVNNIDLTPHVSFFSFYVFSQCGDPLNTKFKDTMRVYLLNSFLYCTNDLLVVIFWLATTTVLYENNSYTFFLYPSYDLMFYLVYIRLNLGSLSYVFGSLMDIYMTWSRIQIFKPTYKFLNETSVNFYNLFFKNTLIP